MSVMPSYNDRTLPYLAGLLVPVPHSGASLPARKQSEYSRKWFRNLKADPVRYAHFKQMTKERMREHRLRKKARHYNLQQ